MNPLKDLATRRRIFAVLLLTAPSAAMVPAAKAGASLWTWLLLAVFGIGCLLAIGAR